MSVRVGMAETENTSQFNSCKRGTFHAAPHAGQTATPTPGWRDLGPEGRWPRRERDRAEDRPDGRCRPQGSLPRHRVTPSERVTRLKSESRVRAEPPAQRSGPHAAAGLPRRRLPRQTLCPRRRPAGLLWRPPPDALLQGRWGRPAGPRAGAGDRHIRDGPRDER